MRPAHSCGMGAAWGGTEAYPPPLPPAPKPAPPCPPAPALRHAHGKTPYTTVRASPQLPPSLPDPFFQPAQADTQPWAEHEVLGRATQPPRPAGPAGNASTGTHRAHALARVRLLAQWADSTQYR